MANAPAADNLQAQLLTKAWEDDGFKQELLTDPRAAIQRELGVELPADLEIEVVEETPNKIFLVVPVRPDALSGAELSDDELEAVAGGFNDMKAIPVTLTMPNKLGGFGRLALLTATRPPYIQY
jgi:hypothetical protein